MVEVLDRTVEGAGRAERADVDLVEHAARQRQSAPPRVGPGERRVVDEPGQAVHAFRLEGRARVGPRRPAIEAAAVVRSARHHGPPALGAIHREPAAADNQLDPFWAWCPYLELHQLTARARRQGSARAV